MQKTLKDFIPPKAEPLVNNLLLSEHLFVKVTNERKTKHGDYRQLSKNQHQITVNGNLNPYRFLITLVHEIAHFEAFQTFGRSIKPHGIEWKRTFQHLILPFLNPDIFPADLLPLLANHFRNPKASSDTDVSLAFALKQFDPPNNNTFVFEVPLNKIFIMYNGRQFKKGPKRRKRYECTEIETGRLYLFNPNAEVKILD